MTYQHKYKITFGNQGQPHRQVIEVYAFDIKSAIEVALLSLKDEPTIPPITNAELVKDI